MDDEVKLSLEKTVDSDIQHIIDSGYVLIKGISIQGFNEETNISKVFCAFKKNEIAGSPLEKY